MNWPFVLYRYDRRNAWQNPAQRFVKSVVECPEAADDCTGAFMAQGLRSPRRHPRPTGIQLKPSWSTARRLSLTATALLVVAGPAAASAGHVQAPSVPAATPPTTTYAGGAAATTTSPVVSGTQAAGTHPVGSTFQVEVCGYATGSSVAVSVDGQPAGVKTSDTNGCAQITLVVRSASLLDVSDPVTVSIRCGANSLVATGKAGSGQTMIQTVAFVVPCAVPARSGFAFSGANVMRELAVAAVLLVVGLVLVLADRRSRATQRTRR